MFNRYNENNVKIKTERWMFDIQFKILILLCKMWSENSNLNFDDKSFNNLKFRTWNWFCIYLETSDNFGRLAFALGYEISSRHSDTRPRLSHVAKLRDRCEVGLESHGLWPACILWSSEHSAACKNSSRWVSFASTSALCLIISSSVYIRCDLSQHGIF